MDVAAVCVDEFGQLLPSLLPPSCHGGHTLACEGEHLGLSLQAVLLLSPLRRGLTTSARPFGLKLCRLTKIVEQRVWIVSVIHLQAPLCPPTTPQTEPRGNRVPVEIPPQFFSRADPDSAKTFSRHILQSDCCAS